MKCYSNKCYPLFLNKKIYGEERGSTLHSTLYKGCGNSFEFKMEGELGIVGVPNGELFLEFVLLPPIKFLNALKLLDLDGWFELLLLLLLLPALKFPFVINECSNSTNPDLVELLLLLFNGEMGLDKIGLS